MPGCVSQGKTREDVLANIKEAMELWLETWVEDGRDVPQDENYSAIATVEIQIPQKVQVSPQMPPRPVVSGDEARRTFEKAGWQFRSQSGSHMVLTKPGHPKNLSIPRHRQLGPGLLRSLIRDAGTTLDAILFK
jgi:predicted RNA binding protein YcfA (HicA-like mRNA interferase family)